MGNPEEYFLSWNPSAPDTDWAKELAAVKERASTPNNVMAVKLMANQLRRLDQCLSTFVAPADGMIFPHIMAAFPNATWVWITRRDRLDQAISHVIARSTGVYHTIKKTSGFVPGSSMTETAYKTKELEVPYDFQSIMREWQTINMANLAWHRFFSRNKIDHMHLLYENIVSKSGRSGYLTSLSDRVGVTLTEIPERNLAKLSNPIYRNFKEKVLDDLLEKI